MKLLDIEILFIRTIICLISAVGCLWHLTDVARIYLTFETDVNVDFEKDAMVDLPAITICLNSNRIIREDYLKQRLNPPKHGLFYSLSLPVDEPKLDRLQNLTLSEQLSNATYGYENIFHSCEVMKPLAFEGYNPPTSQYFNNTPGYMNCSLISPIREYITYSKKCFLIVSQLSYHSPNENFAVDHDITLRDNGFPLFLLKLNNQFLERPVMFVQPRRVPFLGLIGGQTNAVHLNNTKYSSYTFSYGKTSLSLLPSPYQTKCRDYSEIGYKSLSHCILACKADYFVRNFQGWHPDIPYSEEYSSYVDVQYMEHKLKEDKELDKIAGEQCRQEFGKQDDCHSEYFNLIQMGHFERSTDMKVDKEPELFGIYLYLPTGINTKYFHSPRLHLTEFICYFGSIFSLWFGFSMITTSKMAIKLYKLYHKAREQPVGQLQQSFRHTITKGGGSTIRIRAAEQCFVR